MTLYHIKINYKSGNTEYFWVTDFTVSNLKYSWEKINGSYPHPLSIGASEIESVWVVNTKKIPSKEENAE